MWYVIIHIEAGSFITVKPANTIPPSLVLDLETGVTKTPNRSKYSNGVPFFFGMAKNAWSQRLNAYIYIYLDILCIHIYIYTLYIYIYIYLHSIYIYIIYIYLFTFYIYILTAHTYIIIYVCMQIYVYGCIHNEQDCGFTVHGYHLGMTWPSSFGDAGDPGAALHKGSKECPGR